MSIAACRAPPASLAALLILGAACAAHAQTASDLAGLSIEELGDVQVTSVSKRPEAVGEAPASIYVITRDEILRSGAATVPEMLRLAPNLQVYQASASRYVITARGFNGAPAAQNFSNKLLVLIDGRTVYTPLFSGVYWDMQDVLPEDVDRIEVISGPGATLWGANAVNGVINIITRSANDTQGGFVSGAAGDEERSAGVRYGGRLSDTASYRAYFRGVFMQNTRTAAGAPAYDHWWRPQAGFRLDWTPSAKDAVTVQGDLYHGAEGQAGAPDEDIIGRNLTARWTRTLSPRSTVQLQAFYDHAERGDEVGGSGFYVDTYDVDLQHSFGLGARQQIVWGGGYRRFHYHIFGTQSLFWTPPARTMSLANGFVQDTVTLTRDLKLVAGLKLEDDPYIKPQVLPDIRLSFTPAAGVMLWGAVSRAIRAPTPFDREVQEVQNGLLLLQGGPGFRPEELTAYELGAKVRASSRASVSVSAYYNDYDDLRTIELGPTVLPLQWGNLMKARTYGLEAWGEYQVRPWWRLSAGVSYLHETFRFKPGAGGLVGLSQAANDPSRQAMLKSSMILPGRLTLDADLRYVGAMPDPHVPGYTELNGRIGWSVTDRVELGLSARNLLRARHIEYTGGDEIPRSLLIDLKCRF